MNEAQIEETLRSGGARAILDSTSAITGKEKIATLKLAIRKIAFGTWPDRYLDDMIELGDAALSHALSIGEKDEANIVCFNMSANLCDCWNDAYKREQRHFEKGLSYADRALEFRRQLGKTPDKVAMAHWARGKHLLSLRRFGDASSALKENLDCVVAANGADEPETLEAAKAYLGIARQAAGEPDGKAMYQQAIAALTALKEQNEKKAGDIQMYMDQLEATKNLLAL